MKDTLGREIRYLRVSLTDLCNLRCVYCMPPEGVSKQTHRDILSLEETEEIVQEAVALGVRKVRLTGGEPLVRRGMVSLCRRLRAIPELEELAVTTNGLLLPQMASELKEAGVDRVNISIDTLNPVKYNSITRIGSLDDALRGIEAAWTAGLRPLKLNCVLIGGFNDDEIPAFAALTEQADIEVRFIELMPMGPCAGWEKSRFLSSAGVLARFPELEPIESQGVALRYRLPGARGTVGFICPLSHTFCAQCRRLRVTADGKLKSCLHSREEISLKGLRGPGLEEAIRQGILQKPQEHHLTERPSDTPRNMNQIGG